MRKPLVDIPKNLNRNYPAKTKTIKVIKETIVARLTTDCRSLSVIPCVIVRNTGIVPNGFVNVKKEVKQSKAKGNIVSIAVVSLYVIFSPQKYDLFTNTTIFASTLSSLSKDK